MAISDVLLRVPLRIEIVSPVHIGTDETITNKSFVRQNQRIHIADETKFLNEITQTPRLQASFEKFCLSREPLFRFMQNNGLDIQQISQYSLTQLGPKTGSSILPFIKTPGSPAKPYIPGSSIKGALRSAFLRDHILSEASNSQSPSRQVRKMFGTGNTKIADDELEKEFFGLDQHHEWLRLLQITDSRAESLENLGVADVRTFSSNRNRQLYEKNFILSPEVLIPDTKLFGHLVVNQYLTLEPADKKLDFKAKWLPRVADFAKVCNRVAAEQIQQEIEFFNYHHQNDLVRWYKKLDDRRKNLQSLNFSCLIRLGWGAGYDDKTVSDVFDDQTFDDIRRAYQLPVGKPGRRGKPLEKFLSPKSRKLAVFKKHRQEQLLPLGWIVLRAQ